MARGVKDFSSAAQNKFDAVMQEFGNQTLISGGTGNIVSDQSQAVAIAFDEARRIETRRRRRS